MPKIQAIEHNGRTISKGDEFKVLSDFDNQLLLEGMIVKAIPYISRRPEGEEEVYDENKDVYDASEAQIALKYLGKNGEIDFGDSTRVFEALNQGKLKVY